MLNSFRAGLPCRPGTRLYSAARSFPLRWFDTFYLPKEKSCVSFFSVMRMSLLGEDEGVGFPVERKAVGAIAHRQHEPRGRP